MSQLRVAMWLAGLLTTVAGLSSTEYSSLAQVLPQPSQPGPGLSELLSHPGAWLTDMFNSALLSLGQKTTGDVVGFMDWLLGNGNVISQTPAALSYDNPAVRDLWGTMRVAGDAGLAAVTVWGAVNLMVHPHIRAPYHGALELLPRVVLSGIMINSSLYWGRFVVDLNNAVCKTIGGGSIPGWGIVQQPLSDGGTVLLNLIAMAIYLVMGLLLMGQMLMRLALVDALLVIAPLALLCWVLPQTYSWARLWFSTFFGTVFVQAIQVLVLRLGADLIQQLPSVLTSIGSNPMETGRVWLTTLLLGMAVLQLARKIPRLVPGVPGGLGNASTGAISVRQITSIFSSGKTESDRKGGKR